MSKIDEKILESMTLEVFIKDTNCIPFLEKLKNENKIFKADKLSEIDLVLRCINRVIFVESYFNLSKPQNLIITQERNKSSFIQKVKEFKKSLNNILDLKLEASSNEDSNSKLDAILKISKEEDFNSLIDKALQEMLISRGLLEKFKDLFNSELQTEVINKKISEAKDLIENFSKNSIHLKLASDLSKVFQSQQRFLWLKIVLSTLIIGSVLYKLFCFVENYSSKITEETTLIQVSPNILIVAIYASILLFLLNLTRSYIHINESINIKKSGINLVINLIRNQANPKLKIKDENFNTLISATLSNISSSIDTGLIKDSGVKDLPQLEVLKHLIGKSNN